MRSLSLVAPNRSTFEYTTLLALFGGNLRIEPHNSSIRTNRAIMLKSSCIRGMTCFPPNRASLDNRETKDSVLQTCKIVFAPLRLESYSTDGRIHGQTLEIIIPCH